MALRFESYRTRRLDNLGDPEWHNRRWQDIDLRMHARELDSSKVDDAVDNLTAVALARLNDTFSPLIQQAMDQLASVGLSFGGQSLTTQIIDPAVKTFIITEQYRTGMVVVDYVSIRPTGVNDAGMICSVLSYDRKSGALQVDPIDGYITGTGVYSDWQIRVSVTPNLGTYTRDEVDSRIEAVVGNAPDTLDTLGKISDALGGGGGLVVMRANNLSDLISAASARANLGLGNVNNTSDANKPVSTATSQALSIAVASVFPTGTTMTFAQAVVPTGWTRSTTHNDKAMRVVSGSGGGSGGVQAWSTVFARTNVDNTTLDGNTLPSHAHSLYDPGHGHGLGDPGHAHGAGGRNQDAIGWYPGYGSGPAALESSTDGAGTGMWVGGAGTGMGVYAAGASWGHSHGIDLRCQYVDVLIGVKV